MLAFSNSSRKGLMASKLVIEKFSEINFLVGRLGILSSVVMNDLLISSDGKLVKLEENKFNS